MASDAHSNKNLTTQLSSEIAGELLYMMIASRRVWLTQDITDDQGLVTDSKRG